MTQTHMFNVHITFLTPAYSTKVNSSSFCNTHNLRVPLPTSSFSENTDTPPTADEPLHALTIRFISFEVSGLMEDEEQKPGA